MADQTNSKRKILFVDDDKFLLDMYALKFTKAGYDVRACDGAEIALQTIADGFVPDIILADIVMPGIDGLDFVAKIRQEKLASSAVIIMLTNQGAILSLRLKTKNRSRHLQIVGI